MIEKTRAVVLKRIKYSDSGIIVNLYTEKYGRQTVLIKGGHSRKAKVKSSLFQVLNVLEIELDYKIKREIHSVRDAVSVQPLHDIFINPEKSAMAFFIAEVLVKSLREEEPNMQLFELISKNIFVLEDLENNYQNFHLSFLVHLISHIGFKPATNYSNETPFFNLREGLFLPMNTISQESLDIEQSKVFIELMRTSPLYSGQLMINQSMRRILIQKIIAFYNFHIPSFGSMKTLPVLQEVFA